MLPIDAFPRAIDTDRLHLRNPEEHLASAYAAQAQSACLLPTPLSNAEAQRFADFMIGHWRRYGFGFLVAATRENTGVLTTIGHIGFKYTDARPGIGPSTTMPSNSGIH